MDEVAIRVEKVSKRYRLGGGQLRYGSLRESLTNALTAPLRQLFTGEQRASPQYIWALKDVYFEVKRGEVLGIIGRNGAGKSTLLKILSHITKPTSGKVTLHGRVGSLLEVGTGFHPELSGWENIYLNGAILGMKRAEIERKFDEIVNFAEIEQFLDTPVKHYSSGMYMRLAFAVAAHLEPEILLVDEVLAVGDTAFQKKCLGKMGEVAKTGRTVLFVSHNMGAVKALCQIGIFLDQGVIQFIGDISDTVNAYLNSGIVQKIPQVTVEEKPDLPIQLLSVSVVNEEGELVVQHPYEKPFGLKITVLVRSRVSKYYLAAHIHDNDLNTIIFSRDFELDKKNLQDREPGIYTYIMDIPGLLLVPAMYRVSVHVAKASPPQVIHGVDFVCPFEIIDSGSVRAEFGFPWVGKIAMPHKWRCIDKIPLKKLG